MANETVGHISMRSGREALIIGRAAEVRFAGRVIDVLRTAGAGYLAVEMNDELDGREKVDVRVKWRLSGVQINV